MEEKLIEAVRNYEFLYNKKLLPYRNKKKRAEAWSSISDELNIPEDICQARWKSLRDKYVKKVAESHRASISGEDMGESMWQYQDQMEFLREHVQLRRTMAGVTPPAYENGREASKSRKRVKREPDSEPFENVSKKMPIVAELRFPGRSEPKDNPPHEGFFAMVRELFDDLPSDSIREAKFFFLNYLRDQIVWQQQN